MKTEMTGITVLRKRMRTTEATREASGIDVPRILQLLSVNEVHFGQRLVSQDGNERAGSMF